MPEYVSLIAIAGILILACGYLLVMQILRLLRKDPSVHRPQTTRVGLMWYGLGAVLLISERALPVVAPNSWLGSWLSEHGSIVYLGIGSLWLIVIGVILTILGYPIMTEGKKQ